MATKAAKVTACVLPEIRPQAADVIECVGLTVSILINSLYRQIIGTIVFRIHLQFLRSKQKIRWPQHSLMK